MDLDIQVKLQQIQLTGETGIRIKKGYRQLLFLRATGATKRLRQHPPPATSTSIPANVERPPLFFFNLLSKKGNKKLHREKRNTTSGHPQTSSNWSDGHKICVQKWAGMNTIFTFGYSHTRFHKKWGAERGRISSKIGAAFVKRNVCEKYINTKRKISTHIWKPKQMLVLWI